jgi:purine-binding chemotaxis protein CheW
MQIATFQVENLLLGLPVKDVQEILRPQAMTTVPLAPAVVEGLINLRGQIVTALDLRQRMGLADHAREKRPMNIVVRAGESATSLLVDAVGDVVEVEPEALEPAPDNLPEATREVVSGIHQLEGRLLLVLDLERVLREKAAV